ncbi:MAG: hypothetical protein PVI57_20105 [Gemmatimonadota bacterium]
MAEGGRSGLSEIHVLSDEGDRGFHMGRRLRRSARRAGVGPGGATFLEALHACAMEPRRAALADPRHPDFLHPGRSALILLLDGGVTAVDALAATVVLDTARPGLAPPDDVVERVAAAAAPDETPADGLDRVATARAALGLRRAVPRPDATDLTEALVVAPEPVRLVALAERLDHLRHAHLRGDPGAARRALGQAFEVYLPVAERTHPVLARRYASWCRTFARRRP